MSFLILFSILALGEIFRLYNINWDHGFHLHPDERAIVLFALNIHLPSSLSEFFSPNSPLNPHFFAYGNFPLYLLRFIGSLVSFINPVLGMYDGIVLVGRVLSACIDVGTIVVLYKIGAQFFTKKVGLYASLFYALSVFPIQASHYYAVDILLTFFITLTVYGLLHFYKSPSTKNAFFVGLFFGLSLATKISALPILFAITLTIAFDFLLLFIKYPHKPHIWTPHIPLFLKRLFTKGLIIFVTTMLIFFIAQPYALIDFKNFWLQNLQQSQMTKDAFTFPYTLQYVGITPYIYELQNVFFWGQGPLLASLCFIGFLYCLLRVKKQTNRQTEIYLCIILSFFTVYFGIVGNFKVGWMRYMLPLYPSLCFFGALFFVDLQQKIKYKKLTTFLFIISLLIWPVSFLAIYTRDHPRVSASSWITANISPGKTIAVEHWDDSLPLFGQQYYHTETLELYNPDTEEKWQKINEQLKRSYYIVLSSNRLYVPLQKLTDCQHLPEGRCYPKTALYYQRLLSEKLDFEKVAEFSSFPTIPLLNIPINDQAADESFTVYDHPKVLIFKKRSL